MPPKAIPDRWIPYKACGEVIQGTRIICFKVPLKLNVQQNVREIEKIWDIPTVLADIPKLGAVIDLTNTTRYYNPEDFLKANISHRKILMPGRIIPPESSVREFMKAVDEFLAKDSESLVGVHCTHGLNRTGYMVCRYMRDRLGIPAQEAVTRFQVARGYEIERDNYVNDLLGSHRQTAYTGKETKIRPVESRLNDVTYKSPLAQDSYYSSIRFGNSRSNNDSYGYNSNRNSSSRNTGSVSNDGLFSCYTNRYNNEAHDSNSRSRNGRVRRPDGSPLSWRKTGESSTHSSSHRNRNDDNSGYNRTGTGESSTHSSSHRNRNDDNSGYNRTGTGESSTHSSSHRNRNDDNSGYNRTGTGEIGTHSSSHRNRNDDNSGYNRHENRSRNY